ncbi:hydrophobic protein [Streptomyces erythrochromogenes]|uniref:hydrophobic protein n=1 Tax=Streptomyces erythrochromogenes TaxID=285574 RepID=UPI0037023A18
MGTVGQFFCWSFLFGAGFAVSILWWVAIAVLILWLIGFAARPKGSRSRWYSR